MTLPAHTRRPALRPSAIGAGLLLVLALGCKDDSAEDVVRDLVEDSRVEENRAVERICGCWSELDFESENDCLDRQTLPSLGRCFESAYTSDPAGSEPHLECLLGVQGELTACLDRHLGCEEFDPAERCFELFTFGRDECVEPPVAVAQELDECRPGGSATAADPEFDLPDDDDDDDDDSAAMPE